jgi:type III restriction enzyme
LRESSMEKLMPLLVPSLRRKVKEFRDGGYVGAADTSKREMCHSGYSHPSGQT